MNDTIITQRRPKMKKSTPIAAAIAVLVGVAQTNATQHDLSTAR